MGEIELEARVARLEALLEQLGEAPGAGARPEVPDAPAPDDDDATEAFSRRRLLTRFGVTAAGAVTAATVLGAEPAAAGAQGEPVISGAINTSTLATQFLSTGSQGIRATGVNVGVFGEASGGSGLVGSSSNGIGVEGRTLNGTSAVLGLADGLSPSQAFAGAVSGVASTLTGVAGRSTFDVGVYGETGDDGTAGIFGAQGTQWSVEQAGVAGTSMEKLGVFASSRDSQAVLARSDNGVGVEASGGLAPLRLVPTATTGAPVAGTHAVGEVVVDVDGSVFVCTAAPGTWRRLSYSNVELLPRPVRVRDTRAPAPGTKLAAGAALTLTIPGTYGDITIPGGIRGVVGTVTVTATEGSGGYLGVFPQGNVPAPANATSNVNWFGGNQTLAASFTAAVNPANGQLVIHNGISGGGARTHVIVDVAGYLT